MEENNCCKPRKKPNSFWQGLLYGLIPHTGCILFIISSVLGATVLMQFFKPLLMNRYIFHALIGVSIGFLTGYYFHLNLEGKYWMYIASPIMGIGCGLVIYGSLFERNMDI